MFWPPPVVPLLRHAAGRSRHHPAHRRSDSGIRWRLGRELKTKAMTGHWCMPNSTEVGVDPLFAGIPAPHRLEGREPLLILLRESAQQQRDFPLMVQRYMALAFASTDDRGLDAQSTIRRECRPLATGQARSRLRLLASPILGLCPGARFGPAKRWPGSLLRQHCRTLVAPPVAGLDFAARRDRDVAATC